MRLAPSSLKLCASPAWPCSSTTCAVARYTFALIYAGCLSFRSRITRHDAPASVRRAYTAAEVRAMLAATDAARVEIHSHYLCRMGIIAWKSAQSEPK